MVGSCAIMAAVVPELDVSRVRRWADDRIPAASRDQTRIEVVETPRGLTIYSSRPPWDELAGRNWIRTPIARLTYVRSRNEWTLYQPDRNGRFRRYPQREPSRFVAELLEEIDADPAAVFWG